MAIRSFLPGQRVLCIDGNFHQSAWEYVDEVPIEGSVYTVREVRLNACHHPTGEIGPALRLVELSGRLSPSHEEVSWFVYHFEPLATREEVEAELTADAVCSYDNALHKPQGYKKSQISGKAVLQESQKVGGIGLAEIGINT